MKKACHYGENYGKLEAKKVRANAAGCCDWNWVGEPAWLGDT